MPPVEYRYLPLPNGVVYISTEGETLPLEVDDSVDLTTSTERKEADLATNIERKAGVTVPLAPTGRESVTLPLALRRQG